ncbi:hypothetical protein MJ585_09890 [Klebsiella pneumoniae]|nr:hypothetical protein MJ585_09890 [Klebsiella pneumoniae]
MWATRDNVQRHALSMSMPCWPCQYRFALMIFFRNFIFTYFDKRLPDAPGGYSLYRSGVDCGYYHFAILVIIALTPATGAGTIR